MAIYNVSGDEINTTYKQDGIMATDVYDVNGNLISGIVPLPLDYSSYTTTDLFTYVANGFNGLDVHDEVIAQIMANDKLYLFGIDGTTIAEAMEITANHGDSASFTKKYYKSTDEFPLFIVTSDTNPAKVYLNRITRNSTMLIMTYSFPLDKAGYYAAAAYDEKNHTMYMVGYLQQNYQTDDGGNNKTVVSKWDMSQLTKNGDGTYTPVFITRYFRDFIFVMQGQQFFDGYIWIASGHNNGGAQYIYAMNPSDGVIEHTITLDDRIEIEGLAWVYDSTDNKYWMLIGQQNGSAGINYSRIDFATLEES